MNSINVNHDQQNHFFYANVDGGKAKLDYVRYGDKFIDYKSTYVPEDARHEGVGSTIAEEALEYARENELKVKATCPFVQEVMDHHPEYKKLQYQAF